MGMTFVLDMSDYATPLACQTMARESEAVLLDDGLFLTVVGRTEHHPVSNLLSLLASGKSPVSKSRTSIHGLLANTFRDTHCISAILRSTEDNRPISDQTLDALAEYLRDSGQGLLDLQIARLDHVSSSSSALFADRDLLEYRFQSIAGKTQSDGLQNALAKFTAGASAHEVPIAHFHFPRNNGAPSLVITVAPRENEADTPWMDLFALQCAHVFDLAVSRTVSSNAYHRAEEELLPLRPDSTSLSRREQTVDNNIAEATAVVSFSGKAQFGLINNVLESIRTATGHYPLAGTATVLAGLTTGSVSILGGRSTDIHKALSDMSLSVKISSLFSNSSESPIAKIEYWLTWNTADEPGVLLKIVDALTSEARKTGTRLQVDSILCRTTAPGSRCVGKLRFTVPSDDQLDDNGPQDLSDLLRTSFGICSYESDELEISTTEPAGPPWLNPPPLGADPQNEDLVIDLRSMLR